MKTNQKSFCSKICSGSYRSKSNHLDGKIIQKTFYEIECSYCHKIVSVRAHKKKDRYCSRKCGATAANMARGFRSEETKKKIGDSVNKCNITKGISRKDLIMLCPICHIEFKPRNNRVVCCSNSCASKRKWLDTSFRENIIEKMKNSSHKGWKSRKQQSYPEKFWENILREKGFKFEVEKVFKHSDLGLDTSSCYRVDFYFDSLRLAVEIDGSQHRKFEDRILSDRIRDRALRNNGITIIRFPWYGLSNRNIIKTREQVEILTNILNLGSIV